MTAQQLSALDLLLTTTGAALFFGAAVFTLSDRAGSRWIRTGMLACAGLAALVTAASVVVVAVLAGHGWWFVADKMLVALPIALVTVTLAGVVAGPTLIRLGKHRVAEPAKRRASAGLFIAGYGAVAGLCVAFVVGYPVTPLGAVVPTAVVAGVSGLTWLAMTEPGRAARRPGLVAGLVVLCVLPALGSAGLAFYRNLQPVILGAAGGEHHSAAGAGSGAGAGATLPGTVSVADLRTPAVAVPAAGGQVVRLTLTARHQQVALPSGRAVDGWTFGSLPGPEIRVRQGDLVEVTLANQDIADGVTLHWHGYPVPNGEDGVAGVTQDAVAPGQTFSYRFIAREVGTYWYHTHQVSTEGVQRGLFGALIVEPTAPIGAVVQGVDLVVPVHTFDGIPVVGDTDGVLARAVPPGQRVRVRLINTDRTPHRISVDGTAVTVAAVDGTDLVGPAPVSGRVLRVPAAGRYDVTFQMPDGPVAFGVEGAPDTGLRLSATGDSAPVPFTDGPDLDLLSYGTPAAVPGFADADVTRDATLVLDRQFRFLNGIPTLAQTVNGDVHPFVPPIEVAEGDLLRLTVVNRSAETHPMHPHGHRVLVESRNGEPVRGSPLWLDTFDVQPGEVWTVLLRADNPGIWMAHCHNLEHATQGMVVHLVYQGVSTPYTLGGGPADNRPE
jgi:FtsP/CotA-like multicopper oxidase with cupredoxin domain